LRQIGTLPSTTDPQVLGDYLLSQGVASRALQSAEGWAIWVLDEDKVESARAAFLAYQQNPDDSRYSGASSAAEAARREQARRDREYRKNVRDMRGQYDGLNFPRRPLTIILMAICIAVYIGTMVSRHSHFVIWDNLGFFSFAALVNRQDLSGGLAAIHAGEVWRLVTPIFLHVNLMHLAFNMWATWIEGTLIEYCRGTRTLAVLTFVSAVTSNVGQFIYEVNFDCQLNQFGGISGVGYALFGYIWMKSLYEPEHGMRMHPATVRMMILWLLLGFSGFGIPMANGAHVVGLIVGVLFGLARF
jgi:GlpG protein